MYIEKDVCFDEEIRLNSFQECFKMTSLEFVTDAPVYMWLFVFSQGLQLDLD